MAHPMQKFRYCPLCGAASFRENDEKSKRCPSCGFTYFFNPAAATVAIITNERGELLVTRRAKDPAKGTLDLPGGFCDLRETAEEGVAREVREETGLVVSRAEFLFSLPNTYPYSGVVIHTVDLFFACQVESAAGARAMDDASQLFWLPPREIRPELFGLGSIRLGVQRILQRGFAGEP